MGKGKIEKGIDLLELGLIGFIAFIVVKGIGSVGDIGAGITKWIEDYEKGVEQNRQMAIDVYNTEKIWEKEAEEVNKLMNFAENKGTKEVTNAILNKDTSKILELKARYRKNIEDFSKYFWQAQERIKEINAFVAINQFNPLCYGSCRVAIDNALGEKYDLEQRILYYTEQIKLNRELLIGLSG